MFATDLAFTPFDVLQHIRLVSVAILVNQYSYNNHRRLLCHTMKIDPSSRVVPAMPNTKPNINAILMESPATEMYNRKNHISKLLNTKMVGINKQGAPQSVSRKTI